MAFALFLAGGGVTVSCHHSWLLQVVKLEPTIAQAHFELGVALMVFYLDTPSVVQCANAPSLGVPASSLRGLFSARARAIYARVNRARSLLRPRPASEPDAHWQPPGSSSFYLRCSRMRVAGRAAGPCTQASTACGPAQPGASQYG